MIRCRCGQQLRVNPLTVSFVLAVNDSNVIVSDFRAVQAAMTRIERILSVKQRSVGLELRLIGLLGWHYLGVILKFARSLVNDPLFVLVVRVMQLCRQIHRTLRVICLVISSFEN